MEVYVKLKNNNFSALFTSTIYKNDDDYGNGIYMDIRRNGEEFKYVDCRYISNFNEENTLKDILNKHFGSNIVSIEKISDKFVINQKAYIIKDLNNKWRITEVFGKVSANFDFPKNEYPTTNDVISHFAEQF